MTVLPCAGTEECDIFTFDHRPVTKNDNQQKYQKYQNYYLELDRIYRRALKEGQESLVDGIFKVSIDQTDAEYGDVKCPNHNQKTCKEMNVSITIENTINKTGCRFDSYCLHLELLHSDSAKHHISTIPSLNKLKRVLKTKVLESQEQNSLPSTVKEWTPLGIYPLTHSRSIDNLAKNFESPVIHFSNTLKGVLLPYCHGYDSQPNVGHNNHRCFLHLFNFDHDTITAFGTVKGKHFKRIVIGSDKRCVLS